jgi:hypothetical protein
MAERDGGVTEVSRVSEQFDYEPASLMVIEHVRMT